MTPPGNTPTRTPRIICFGEILLRLAAPDHQLLLQTPQLCVQIGGAEANVAISLAQFGHEVGMVSVLPDNALGRACRAELRRHGVDTAGIHFAPGRVGLYFLTVGAGYRPSQVLYDREASAFALASPELVDWDAQLRGAGWLHVSGVTPALGRPAADAALRAARQARERGLRVSFDCNYRAKLWQRWQGEAPAILRELAGEAELLFAQHKDIELMLGRDFSATPEPERFQQAAGEMLAAFPRLLQVASTVRHERSVDSNELSAVSLSREGLCRTRTYSLERIVDRIGSGDAFAAGLLHGLVSGMSQAAALDFGAAAACLKHSVPGDFNLASVDDVQGLLGDTGFSVRR
jgi:2-dehydro-3-deoxygluconokinase